MVRLFGRCVARRGGQPVPKHVGYDDEVLLGVEGRPGRHQCLVLGVLGPIEGGHDDHVVARGVELPVGLVGDLGLAQRESGLENHFL